MTGRHIRREPRVQIAAIYASGDRSKLSPNITVPLLVIHGLDDALIDPSEGAEPPSVPGSHLLEVADMGHDLPQQLWPIIVGAMLAHADVAAANGAVQVAL